jgi:PKD repeat protein
MVRGTGVATLPACEVSHGPLALHSSESFLSARISLVVAFLLIVSAIGIAGFFPSDQSPVASTPNDVLGSGFRALHEPVSSNGGTGHALHGGNITSVVVGPPSAVISVNSSEVFVASPVCTTLLCPSGTTYQWSLTSSLFGALNASTGQSVRFSSGSVQGKLTLFVNATLNGTTKQSYPVGITINSGILPLGAYLYFDSANSGYAPLTVTATGNGTGGRAPYSMSWNTGDGGSASGVTVTHTYTTAGTFTITLTVTDSRGSNATDSDVVVVLNSNSSGKTLQASVVFESSVIGHLPLNVTMAASVSGGSAPYTYSWTYGDGSTGNGVVVSHAYTSVPSGCNQSRCKYIVNLTATDSVGNVANATSQVTILVNATQTVSVSMTDTPASGVAPLLVSFSANASGGIAPYSFTWAFGDSSTGSGATVQHTYMSPGTYTVVLTGVDSNGSVAQVTSTVLAYPPPSGNETGAIELAIVASPVTGPAPLTTYFSASASGGIPPYSINWSFGDSTPNATGSSTSHTYVSTGAYVATVTVVDSIGNSATTGVFVSVTGGLNQPNQLAVIVTALKLHGTAPLTVTFTPSVIGGSAPYQLTWGFGDGAEAVLNGTTPVTHTYLNPGSYSPTLLVKDTSGSLSKWSAIVSGTQVNENGGGSQPFTTTDWILTITAVVAIALVMVAVVTARRKDRPPSPTTAPGTDSFENITSDDSATEFTDAEDDYGPPRPSPNQDPLHDVFAGFDPDLGRRAVRLKISALNW